MSRADHIRVRFCWKGVIPYWHHGIDMGDSTVIHYTSGIPMNAVPSTRSADDERLAAMEVRRTPIEEFHWGKKVEVISHSNVLEAEVVIDRALGAIGDRAYLLSHNNCEHFATWCKVGTARSWQVEGMESLALSTVSATAKSALAYAAKQPFASAALAVASKPLATAAVAIKPIFLLADVAEYCSYLAAQRIGYEEESAKTVSRWTGRSTAAAIGLVSGGPAGAAAAITVHEMTGRISESVCQCVKKQIAPAAAS